MTGRPATPQAASWLPLLRAALANAGAFRVPLRGISMRPTLPAECEIEIVPAPAHVRLGELIVFMAGNTLIAHRLVRRASTLWITQGDGLLAPDRPLTPAQILGIVMAAYARGQRCWPTQFSRPLAGFWIARHWALRVARWAFRKPAP